MNHWKSKEFNKDQELHHRSMSELRDVFERQLEKMREEVRVKEQDLHKVRTGGDGSNLCHLKSDLVFAIPKKIETPFAPV